MGVIVTIRPHKVYDAGRKRNVEFDQFQILIGQRVCGYLAKDPECGPTLVVRDLPEDCLSAINEACDKVHKRGKYTEADGSGSEKPSIPATVTHPIGSDPAKEPPAELSEPDAADSAALEQSLESENK